MQAHRLNGRGAPGSLWTAAIMTVFSALVWSPAVSAQQGSGSIIFVNPPSTGIRVESGASEARREARRQADGDDVDSESVRVFVVPGAKPALEQARRAANTQRGGSLRDTEGNDDDRGDENDDGVDRKGVEVPVGSDTERAASLMRQRAALAAEKGGDDAADFFESLDESETVIIDLGGGGSLRIQSGAKGDQSFESISEIQRRSLNSTGKGASACDSVGGIAGGSCR